MIEIEVDTIARWNVFSSVRLRGVCLFVCLFVNSITLELFEILSLSFIGARYGQKLGVHSDALRHTSGDLSK